MGSDDLQQKLIDVKNLREQGQDTPPDPRELAERKRYHALYNRIYPMLMKSTFDFAEVAEVAGLRVRRMRDALLSRLALDNMVKLVGCTPGSCYVCGSAIRGYYREEPFCIYCLRSIEVAISSLYPVEKSTKKRQANGNKGKLKHEPTILDDLLACGAPLMAITGVPDHSQSEILRILNSDDEPKDELEEIFEKLKAEQKIVKQLSLKPDLRRFGFQRGKPRE